ncbi:hypothetical protein EVAR_37501_1 [Eumeta japonica]|uniref:Uncharacterized protein n=1 Tax=Eumeta variegata TaxID=151549 RepID=A0A4C1XE48_EUMVA|nr:hypothetical protein EVAR_37501_1 [Eumeta japonica]
MTIVLVLSVPVASGFRAVPRSHIGPGTAHLLETQRKNPLVSTAAKTTRPTTEDVQKRPNLFQNRPTFKRLSNTPSAPRRDLTNFPALPATKPTLVGTKSRPASAPAAPSTNPWTNEQPPQQPRAAAQGPQGEAIRRAPPAPSPATASAGPSSFGDDIQTVMAVLRAVSSSEIAEFASQLRACRNVEEKLLVLVRYHHLTVRLESI